MPASTVKALLDAVVAGDDASARALAPRLSPSRIARLRVRHSTVDGTGRLDPEITIEDGDTITVVVWLPLPALHEGKPLDIFCFDTFTVHDGAVVDLVTSEAPSQSYRHTRTDSAARAPYSPVDPTPDRTANLDLMNGFYRDVFDAQNPDAVGKYVAEGYIQHARWRGEDGREALAETVREIFSPKNLPPGMPPLPPGGLPPLPTVVQVAQGDIVARAAELPFGSGHVFDAFLVADGLLAEHWSGVDPRHKPMP